MTRWFRVAEGFFTSPKVVNAGRDGALVFLALLDVNSAGQRDGRIPAIEATPRALAARLVAADVSAKRAASAIERCVQVGLVARDGDALLIVGWDDEWRPSATSTERSRRWRMQRDATLHDVASQRCATVAATETQRGATVAAIPPCTPPDRGEEKRREEKRGLLASPIGDSNGYAREGLTAEANKLPAPQGESQNQNPEPGSEEALAKILAEQEAILRGEKEPRVYGEPTGEQA